ncbi:hypothetical protein CEXT_611461 [Caerostris extrusa]|uniref:Uncharacterized protein n=1 Tax=Caerostris extrusa TaxID=172846 RepID=A0AAV4SJV4_CAEEX|nr:hypothetical protein CEXT_611461 [Caerostris extrusa]
MAFQAQQGLSSEQTAFMHNPEAILMVPLMPYHFKHTSVTHGTHFALKGALSGKENLFKAMPTGWEGHFAIDCLNFDLNSREGRGVVIRGTIVKTAKRSIAQKITSSAEITEKSSFKLILPVVLQLTSHSRLYTPVVQLLIQIRRAMAFCCALARLCQLFIFSPAFTRQTFPSEEIRS